MLPAVLLSQRDATRKCNEKNCEKSCAKYLQRRVASRLDQCDFRTIEQHHKRTIAIDGHVDVPISLQHRDQSLRFVYK